MRFLLDTNVLIPLEPGADDPVALNAAAAEFHSLVQTGSHSMWLHPAVEMDLKRDPDEARRARTRRLAAKYPRLLQPPLVSSDLAQAVGQAVSGSNDWVDNQLLAAVVEDAVDYLVTEDTGIHRKADRAGVGNRVATIAETSRLLRALFDRVVEPPPAVAHFPAYQLQVKDPIFDGLRADYGGAEFDQWLAKVRREGRPTWVIQSGGVGPYAALAICKTEHQVGTRNGRVLKICTFKVAEGQRGRHYGELMLKTLFQHAAANNYPVLYLEVYPKQEVLVRLLEDFGFRLEGEKDSGELILVKLRQPERADALSALEYHVRFGPPAIQDIGTETFLVPVQPHFHRRLFPELEVPLTGLFQLGAFDPVDTPYGNALRKAYLCRAQQKTLKPGAVLLFYRSGDIQGVTAVGILEMAIRSADPGEIARFVGKRTVYPYEQIEDMCAAGEVLALLFRQDRLVDPSLELKLLVANGAIGGPPQSISRVKKEALPWLGQKISA